MWERTLQDLIRGLRATKKDEAKFIAKAMGEIKEEVRGKDMELKAAAVLKLTYLYMMGYDMGWASFHVVEVMSSPKAHLKSVGYLAAVQSFDQDTDVLMLTTNLVKKDLISTPSDVAVVLNGLSHILTPDLARDLAPEIIPMLNHSRAHIRKRAILLLFKVLLKYPEASTSGLTRLRERLEDPDPGVVAATVNVLCELGRRHPQDYLILAPPLFHLLTTSSNNWMLIKIVKLFGFLSPHEPRLVKKLQSPITELISTTPAISLLFECVHTCIIGGMLQGPTGDSLARTCVSKLAAFLQDSDQNLKYIALLALVKIVPSHPHLVAEYQDMILASVNDQDISIRMRALDLISAMVDRSNLQSIVQQILSHLVPGAPSVFPTAAQSLAQNSISTSSTSGISPSQSPSYRLVLARRILTICSQSTYDNVTNFEWYLSVLVDLAHVANVNVGEQIRDQLVDIVGRVRASRRYAVKLMYTLLSDDTILRSAGEEGSCAEVLWAAAWICGEYCSELAEPQKLLPYILQPAISNLDAEIIAVYIQAATKIFGYWAADLAPRWDDGDLPEVKAVVDNIIMCVRKFTGSPHVEVQERAANTLQLFTLINADLNAFRPKQDHLDLGSSFDPINSTEPLFPKSLFLIEPLFSSYELNPVAANAQASVPIPEGLDLDAWIVPSEALESLEEVAESEEPQVKKSRKGKEKESNGKARKGKKKRKEDSNIVPPPAEAEVETPEDRAEAERRKAERLERLRDDPYYIMDEGSMKPSFDDLDLIPIVRLDDMPPLPEDVDGPRMPALKEHPHQPLIEPFFVEKEGEMPDSANNSAKSSLPVSRQPTPGPSLHNLPRPTSRASSFTRYDLAEDTARPNTPNAIKVTRAKKSGKKTRTANTKDATVVSH